VTTRRMAAPLIASIVAGAAFLTHAPVTEAQTGIVASTKLTAPGELREFDRFGSSVAISRNIAVVGAPLDDNQAGIDAGAAYVFQRSGTAWSLQTKLVGSNTRAGDRFGSSVDAWGFSSAGRRIIVGAPFNDNSAGADAGAAYVFERSGATGWEERNRINIGHLRGGNDRFGSSVGISRFDAVVGVPLDDTQGPGGLSGAGSAAEFERINDDWGFRGTLTAGSNAGNFELFGTSVATSQKTTVVGAPGDSNGEAYVFVADQTVSPWQLQARLPRSASSRDFGASVAVDGNSAIVGAPAESTFFGTGVVHIFVRSGTAWSEQSFLFSPTDIHSFGSSVAISGDIALVGSPNAHAGPDPGFAWLYVRSGTTWASQIPVGAADGLATDRFGSSVDVSVGTAVIGAPNDDTSTGVDSGTDTGSAYVVSVP
jgi:hypothetical protein